MNQEEIGKFIATLRKENGLTQAELGDKLGVTNKTVSRWENGNYMPDISLLQGLAQVLEINVNELLSAQRLNDQDFRREADTNIVTALEGECTMRKQQKRRDLYTGMGTGLLISAIMNAGSNPFIKVLIVAVGLAMIGAGWYYSAKLDQYLFTQKGGASA